MKELVMIFVMILFGFCSDLFACQKTDQNSISIQSDIANDEFAITDYFSTVPLRESPYPDFKGIFRITQSQALKRNHYRFEYDDLGKLREVSFRNGNIIIYPNHTANIIFQTPIIRFDYEDGKEIRTFYDRNRNQITSRGAYREVFELDKLGKRIGLSFENVAGEKIQQRLEHSRIQMDPSRRRVCH